MEQYQQLVQAICTINQVLPSLLIGILVTNLLIFVAVVYNIFFKKGDK